MSIVETPHIYGSFLLAVASVAYLPVARPPSGMSLAARTREAVRAHPFLYAALRAGVCNYTAAARYLDLGADDEEAVVAALRRYAEDLPAYDPAGRDARVAMKSGLGRVEDGGDTDSLLAVGDVAFTADGGSMTGLLVTGEVDATALRHVLGALAADDIDVEAAGVTDAALLVVVSRRAGADAVRVVESALETVPGE